MPTVMTHAAVGAAFGVVAPLARRRGAFLAVSAGLAMLPDLDVIGLALGVPSSSMWSHRGLTHSLVAALVVGFGLARLSVPSLVGARRALGLYFSAVMASHGVLDAATDGGRGIAFLAPFTAERWFLPWRPIAVSPLGLDVLSSSGAGVLESELRWVWFPGLLIVGAVLLARAMRRRSPRRPPP
jgi:inner membrane protein